jgi:hypothetical protein
MARFAGSSFDATAALLDCIDRAPVGGRVELAPGTYSLRSPLRIVKPVTIATARIADSAAGCATLGAVRCAILRVDLANAPHPNAMPIEIVGNHVSVSHMVVEGVSNAQVRADCARPDRRPLGGGLRIYGSNFTLRKSLLRNFTCYTAMEVIVQAHALTAEDNVIGPNGDHRPGEIWSDGITIHDSQDVIVRRNAFVDNSDVQLILGGCRNCRVENNSFRHGGSFARASFAELMLHAFPNTSGRFGGTIVTGNHIDCGPARLCGFGIMIGANPWTAGYDPRNPAAMSGGSIRGNSVANARIAINIDAATGPVEVRDNRVTASGGRFNSDCGVRDWPAVNIGPGTARWLRGDPSNVTEGSVSTVRCILARQPE